MALQHAGHRAGYPPPGQHRWPTTWSPSLTVQPGPAEVQQQSTGFSAETNPWAPFFGQLEHYKPPVGRSQENWDLPDAYLGANNYMTEVVITQITSADQQLVSTVLPWTKTENIDEFQWSIIEFDDHALNERPEESVSRLVTVKRTNRKASFGVKGIAMQMESGFYKTAQGRQEYAMHLQQMANATVETACFGAAMALLNAPQYEDSIEAQQGLGLDPHNYFRMLQREVDQFNQVQEPGGVHVLLNDALRILSQRGVRPDTTIIPQGMEAWLRDANLLEPTKIPTDVTRALQHVVTSRPIRIGEGRRNPDAFYRVRTVGSIYPMLARLDVDETYRTTDRTIRIWSEDADAFVPITLEEAANASQMWDENYDFTRLGSEVLQQPYQSWAEYLEQTGFLSLVCRAVSWGRTQRDGFVNFLRRELRTMARSQRALERLHKALPKALPKAKARAAEDEDAEMDVAGGEQKQRELKLAEEEAEVRLDDGDWGIDSGYPEFRWHLSQEEYDAQSGELRKAADRIAAGFPRTQRVAQAMANVFAIGDAEPRTWLMIIQERLRLVMKTKNLPAAEWERWMQAVGTILRYSLDPSGREAMTEGLDGLGGNRKDVRAELEKNPKILGLGQVEELATLMAHKAIAARTKKAAEKIGDVQVVNFETVHTKVLANGYEGVVTFFRHLPIVNAHFFKFALESHVPLPLTFLLAAPHQRFECGTMVVCKSGPALGNTHYGWPDFQVSRDTNRKMIFGHLTLKLQSLVRFPRSMHRLEDVFVRDYHGGAGTEFFRERHQEAYQQGDMRMASLFSIAVPPSPHWKWTGKPIDLVGRFNEQVFAGDQDELHYPTAPDYRDYWGWTHGQPNPGDAFEDQDVARFNTVCFPGAYYSYESKAWTFHVNKGHLGTRVAPGTAAIRRGRAMFAAPLVGGEPAIHKNVF